MLPRLRMLLPAVWAGLLLCLALLAAPAAFALLPQADAGRMVGRMLAHEAYTSLAMGVVLLAFARMRDKQRGRAFGVDFGLVLGALFCTVAGHFGVQPLMAAARTGEGSIGFAALHVVSVAFYGLKLVLVALLAWRAAKPGLG